MTLYDLPNPKTRKLLREIPTPKYKGKTRHRATQFGVLADTIIEQLEAAELKVIREDWRTAVNDNVLFGSIDVKPQSMQGPELDEIGCFTLSLRTANNNKYALAFLSGARVDKLDNDDYFCLGDTAVRVRNNKTMDVEETCESAVNMFVRTADQIQVKVNQLKKRQITEAEACQIMLFSAREFMPFRNVEYVFNEWYKNYQALNLSVSINYELKSAWFLWQAFKKSYMKLGAADRFEMSKGLYPIFDQALKLTSVQR